MRKWQWLALMALVSLLFGFCAGKTGGQGTTDEAGPTAFTGNTAGPLVSIAQSGPGDGLDISVAGGNIITGTAPVPYPVSGLPAGTPEKRQVFSVDGSGDVSAASYRDLNGNPIVQGARWPVTVNSYTELTMYLKWPHPFKDAAYTATCSLQLASGAVGDIEYLELANTAADGVFIYLQLDGPTVHIVHCIAVHD